MMIPSSDFDQNISKKKGTKIGSSGRYNQIKKGLPGVGSYQLPSIFDKY